MPEDHEFITVSLPVKLTKDELLEHSRELAKLNEEAVRLENQKKEVSAQFAADGKRIQAQMNTHAVAINNGYEYRPVQCYWAFNWDKGVKGLWRDDTMELVRSEEITAQDRQGRLDEEEKPNVYHLDANKKFEPEKEQTQEQNQEGEPAQPEDCAPERNDAGVCKVVWDCGYAKKHEIGCCKACEDWCEKPCETAKQRGNKREEA